MPEIVELAAQPYVAVRRTVTMATIPEIADRLPRVFEWLSAQGIAPAGAPFFRYDLIDMAGELEMQAGVPVRAEVKSTEDLFRGVLPAGRYVTHTHVGAPGELVEVTAGLLAWADEYGLRWDMTPTDRGERWGCRLETLLTNPAEEPDPSRWATELVFRLADD